MVLTIINAALVVLIWIVQLVVYPGFSFYNEGSMKEWHKIYTKRITVIVMPLMVSQLALYTYITFNDTTICNLSGLLIVMFAWFVTFFYAVPIHQRIEDLHHTILERRKLIRINWLRTAAWTVVLLINLVCYGK